MEEVPKLLVADLRNDEISITFSKEAEMNFANSDVSPTKGESVLTVSTESSDEEHVQSNEVGDVDKECIKVEGDEDAASKEIHSEINITVQNAVDEPCPSMSETTVVREDDSNLVVDVIHPEIGNKTVIVEPDPLKESEVNSSSEDLTIEELKPDPPSQDDSFASATGALNTSINLTTRDETIVFNSPIKPDPPEFQKAIPEINDALIEYEDLCLMGKDDESCSSDVRTTCHDNKTSIAVPEILQENYSCSDHPPLCTVDNLESPSIEVSAPSNEDEREKSVLLAETQVAETTINSSAPMVSSEELADTLDSTMLLVTQNTNVKETEPSALEINVSDKEAVVDDDECSYEEIVVDDDDEFIEYVDEILDDEGFTEETYNSLDEKDLNFIIDGNLSRSSITTDDLDFNASKSSIRDNSFTKRPVIKSATQKALEQEEARKKAEAKIAQKNVEYRLARQNSFTRKDEAFLRQLAEEEAEHLRQEEEQEKRRIEMQERLARQRAEQAMALMAQQQEEELRQQLYNDEVRRQAAEAATHRIAAEKAAHEKELAEKLRRERDEAEKQQRDAKRKAMEEEVKQLQSKLAEAKRAAEEAKKKQIEEKQRLKAKVEAHRREKRRASTTTEPTQNPTEEVSNSIHVPLDPVQAVTPTVDVPKSSIETETSSPDSTVYYSVDELRKQSVPGLDYKNREIYLHPDEFKILFGMSMAEFNEQPKWKRTQMKRKLKLF